MARDLARACREWQLTVAGQIGDTATSRLWRVACADGTPAVLKLLKPYGADEVSGARLLEWWDGQGAVRLLRAADLAMLLELLPGPALSGLCADGRDAAATEAIARLIAELHRPRAHPVPGLAPLEERLEPILRMEQAPLPPGLREHAERIPALARSLLAEAPAPVPLHGDLHHDNILHSERGWVAIDPKGLSGDPAYDVANVFRNPLGQPELALDPARIRHLADRFGALAGYGRARILDWAAVHCALSAIWNHEAGADNAFDLDLLPRLLAVLDEARA